MEQTGTLDNGVIRIGVDRDLGGAITWLSKSGSGENLINSFDWGRQIQMSHYSGPVHFAPRGKQPSPTWAALGWNPIQSGDAFGHRSRLLDYRNNGKEIFVRCVPMQWPLDDVPQPDRRHRSCPRSCVRLRGELETASCRRRGRA